MIRKSFLLFVHLQNWDDFIKCSLDFFSSLCTSQHDLPANEYKKNNSRTIHSIYQPRKYFRLVAGKIMMFFCKDLQSDRKWHRTRCHNILNFELFEFNIKSHTLHNFSIFHSSCFRLLFWFCPGANDFSTLKYQSCCFGLSDSHYYSCKSFRVIFCISRF